MKIVVTGGLGFIGSSFVNLINRELPEVEVIIVDKLTYAGSLSNLDKPNTLIKKDICDITSEDLGEFDYIVNFAAETHVDNSIDDGSPFIKTNIEGTYNLLEVSRSNPKLKKFIQISTDEVYGDLEDNNKRVSYEGDKLSGSSYYAASKAAADLLVQACGRTFQLPYLITRTCNNFGPNQHKEKFIPKLLLSIKQDKPITVYGDGSNIREWIYVEDNVKEVLKRTLDSTTGIKNIGSWDKYTNNQIIQEVENIVGKEIKKTYIEDRKGHDRRYSLSSTGVEVTLFLKDYLKNILNE